MIRMPSAWVDADIKVTRRNRLGGLLHEYDQVAGGDTIFGTHPAKRSPPPGDPGRTARRAGSAARSIR
jgi:hypothetical protein